MEYPRDLRSVVRDLLATEWSRTTEDETLCDLIAELDESLSQADRVAWIAAGQPKLTPGAAEAVKAVADTVADRILAIRARRKAE